MTKTKTIVSLTALFLICIFAQQSQSQVTGKPVSPLAAGLPEVPKDLQLDYALASNDYLVAINNCPACSEAKSRGEGIMQKMYQSCLPSAQLAQDQQTKHFSCVAKQQQSGTPVPDKTAPPTKEEKK